MRHRTRIVSMAGRETLCRLLGHRPEDTGRRSGLMSCARCFDVLPGIAKPIPTEKEN